MSQLTEIPKRFSGNILKMETSGREKSTATNQRCSKAYVGNPRKLEVIKMEKHFFVVHTFISDETRRAILNLPEKRNPPQKTKT